MIGHPGQESVHSPQGGLSVASVSRGCALEELRDILPRTGNADYWPCLAKIGIADARTWFPLPLGLDAAAALAMAGLPTPAGSALNRRLLRSRDQQTGPRSKVMAASLSDEWREAGVQEGDVLLLHSSISRTLRRHVKEGRRLTAHDILVSFLEAIGPSGTLLLPLFNFDFTKGVPFDMRTTPSQMGALTEAGRAHPSAARTGHPIYSFAAIGHAAEEFRWIDNFSGYGSDSPFAVLRAMNGKIAVLDLPDQASMTFYHHVEEMQQVDYRYHKTFTGAYVDELGRTCERTYGLFVRNIERGVLTHVEPAGDLLWKAALYSGDRPNEGCGLRTISANQMYDFVADIILTGNARNTLYRIEGEEGA